MSQLENVTPELMMTEDNSHTLYIKALDETYHSTHGAVNESQHVYIQSGLLHKTVCQDHICVLEIGFGTGLNALLTLIKAEQLKKQIYYQTFEPYPISQELIQGLNYGKLLSNSDYNEFFLKLHHSDWNRKTQITDYFTLEKVAEKFGDKTLEHDDFDVVYFDAFAPNKQPEVWCKNNLKICFDALKRGGVFTTYSVQGIVKRNLISIGFDVTKIPGPKGKREILHAVKPMSDKREEL